MPIKKSDIDITIGGLSDLYLDQFVRQEEIPTKQKLPTNDEGNVVIPKLYIKSFLASQKNTSCARMFSGSKEIAKTSQLIKANFFLNGKDPEILDENDEPIKAEIDGNKVVEQSVGIYTKNQRNNKFVARVSLPWKLKIQATLFEHSKIDANKIRDWFEKGGLQVGIGTFRPDQGRFEVVDFKVK